MNPIKYILIIGDGMADNPLPALGGRTPLEAADKPHIDALAAASTLGSVRTVPPGLPPGSDTAILSILGCDPRRCFTGRSPLEAAGCGVTIRPGEISYRCNMVSLDASPATPFGGRKILSHNAGSIDGADSVELIRWLTADPAFAAAMAALNLRIEPVPSFRHIAVQSGGDLTGLRAAPPHDILGQPIGPHAMDGNDNARALWKLMELASRRLEEHPYNARRRAAGLLPANGVWFWAEGTAVRLPSFPARYGKTGSVISAVPLVHGIGALTGLKPVHVPGATGETETNYEGKVQAALDCLSGGDDFVCLHVEAPDEATHNGNLEEKLLSIHYLDARVAAPLEERLRGVPHRLLLLSDHKTLMSTRTHDGDPVPFLLYDSARPVPTNRPYTEAAGGQGPFVERGTELLDLLFDPTKGSEPHAE